jgi:hypothetical protein
VKLGRKLLLLAIATVSTVLLCGIIYYGNLPSASHNILGVPIMRSILFNGMKMHPTFADMRLITNSIQCKKSGYNPYVTGKCDQWGRLYNYPPIWLELGRFSLGPAQTDIAGGLVAIFFIAVLLTINELRSWIASSIMVLAAVSPPILFGIERGNTDLVVFSLVCLLFYFLNPLRPGYFQIVSAGAIFLTVLKLYPVAICVSLVRARRDIFIAAFVALIASSALVITLGDQFTTFLANQPEYSFRSFGAPVLPLRLTELHNNTVLRVLSTASAACLAVLTLYLMQKYQRYPRLLPVLDKNIAINRIATACSLIYLFTFLLTTNFDYRLVYLLPFVLASLNEFENSLDYAKLGVPVLITLYLWLVPLNHWTVDLASFLVFTIVFLSIGAPYWKVISAHIIPISNTGTPACSS